jgi:hypothetical protein
MSKTLTPEDIEKIKKIPFLFIMGKGRSGTTLLQSFLNSHPNIVAPPESKFIILLSAKFGHVKNWNEARKREFIECLYTEFFFLNLWKPDKAGLTEFLLSAPVDIDYAMMCRLVYYYMRGNKENVLLFSDKNPIYPLFYGTILKLFPDAKFIHIVRDPRDNVLSHLKTYNVKNTMFISEQWLVTNQLIEERKKQMPDRHFTLHYENMVADTAKAMAAVCNYLSLPYAPAMLEVNKEEAAHTYGDNPALFQQVHKNIVKPVSTDNVAKWKTQMSPEDIAIVQAVAGEYAKSEYGYETYPLTDSVKTPSSLSLMRGAFKHSYWMAFTRYRYKHYNFNLFYAMLKRKYKIGGVPIWERTHGG